MISVPPRSEEAATHHALSGESRQALLGVLRRRGGPIDAAEAGEAVGLHRNTARVHLDVLVSVGLVTRSFEERTARGRPRVLYAVAGTGAEYPDGPPEVTGYGELARLLADQLTEVAYTRHEAVRAGRRWAAGIAGNPPQEQQHRSRLLRSPFRSSATWVSIRSRIRRMNRPGSCFTTVPSRRWRGRTEKSSVGSISECSKPPSSVSTHRSR